MERGFPHPWRMYRGKGAGPWFSGADMPHERWAGRPYPQSSQDYRYSQWGQDPPDPQWRHPNPQWDHPNPRWSQDQQNSQCYHVPQWEHYYPEQPSQDYGYGFDNGNFLHRGSGSYGCSRGKFYGKRSSSSHFYKGKDNPHNSSRVLIEMKQNKKGNDSEVKKDESAIPAETKQAQEDTVASVKNTNPPQQSKKGNDSDVKKDNSAILKETKQAQEDSVALVKNRDPPQFSQKTSNAITSPSQFSFRLPPDSTCQMCNPAKTEAAEPVSRKISKAIISPSQFSFCLPPDSLTCQMCSPAKAEKAELVSLDTGPRTEDRCRVECCTQAAQSELTATLENLKKEEEKIELDKLQDKVTEVQPSQPASLLPSNATGSFCPVIKEEPMPVQLGTPQAIEAHRSPSVSLPCAEAPSGKQAPSAIMKSFCPVIKKEPVLVPEIKQDMDIASLTDPTPVTEPSAPSHVVEPPAPLETKEALVSLKREDELLESSQPTDHFNHVVSPPTLEIPFLSENADECQSEGKEDLELSQMGGSHEVADCRQARDAAGSSVLPAVPSDIQSVPVLVRGKETERPYIWESGSSLHAQNFNWSDGGKGWAPEDYQEPSWGVDEAKKYDDVTEPDRNSVLSHSSFHSHYSCDQNLDTGRVLECRSSSPKSNHSSDSKYYSAQRTTKEPCFKCLRSPLRQVHQSRSPLKQGHHSRSPLRQGRQSRSPLRQGCQSRSPLRQGCQSRSPLRQGRHSSSPLRRRENNLWTGDCNKCHCKYCRSPSQERFQERKLPHSYLTDKRHHNHHLKGSSKLYRTSNSYSPQNSRMKSQTRKRKSTHHEGTKKEKSTSVKQTKSSKVKKKSRNVLAPVNHDAALAVETSITSEITEHFHPVNTEDSESVQLAASSEDTGFPHQSCARKETGTSAPSKTVEDPRSVAVLRRRNQIEQDYLQVMLNFAVVATMLLQKEPCMEEALEVALRANMRSVGDYYESMLKNFIDDYDSSETP
ncbi:serine/arginine repetitive matrix protein 2-like isoform X2 [Eublepharis macularius]|uniref:Serine/arginine repetitive matrix protein 2-like isoform X2 n=1 Tax=Eublepharis macularius TaxID=481883 RepID=A0AA97JDM1_EUBMA|nr:serine/arginine repetitive matrix protein 2-like isoform X2 [Eublepharis macularius]